MVLLSNFASIPLMCIDFALFALFFVTVTTFAMVSCHKGSGSTEAKPGDSNSKEASPKGKTDESEKSTRSRRASDEVPFEVEEVTRPVVSMSEKRSSRRSDKDTITEEIVVPLGKTAKDPLPSSAMTSRHNLKIGKPSKSSKSSRSSIVSSLSGARSVTFGSVRKVKSNIDLWKEEPIVTVTEMK